MTLFPARLEPIFVPRIWGGRSLAPLFPEKSGLSEPIGEVWMTGNDCRFANGPFIGQTLGEVWPTMPSEWAGEKTQSDKPFPLLIKFLFPREKLSVQVHPPDEYARQQEAAAGGIGKTEMWYTMTAEPEAAVLVNFRPGTTPSSFRRALADGAAEECLERLPLQTGNVVFVPAGAVHTIGPGLTLCEIQQNSDITYRVFDYNRVDAHGRLRPLHLEKALAVMNFGEQRGGKIEPVRLSSGPAEKMFFAACPYFSVEKWSFSEQINSSTSGKYFDLMIVLEGTGALETGEESLPYAPMNVWMVPAEMGAYRILPKNPTSLLRVYVPDNLGEVARRLAEEGVPQFDRARVVYP